MRTICLLTAGLGIRMGRYAELTNKTLLPVKGKAIISHIIDQYPAGTTRFVVALGYRGEDVTTYLGWAHPHHQIEYVWIDNFAGPNSGPAYSVRQCAETIGEGEFTLITCDGYYECLASISTGRNVLGVARVDSSLQPLYCNVTVTDGCVANIYDKERCSTTSLAACGVYHIASPDTFFAHLNGVELSSGFAALSTDGGLDAVEILWRDLGSEQFYDAFVREQHGTESFDYSKDGEFLYTVDIRNSVTPQRRVIKYFADSDIVEHRVLRAQKRSYFPPIAAQHGRMYMYPFVEGHTLYAHNSPEIFRRLLNWMETSVWSQHPAHEQLTSQECREFYWAKTYARLAQFRIKHPDYAPQRINGVNVDCSIESALSRIDWDALWNPATLNERTAFIHGDFQFDNIITTPTGDFCLIDWRQDFAGQLWHGDKYYDIAKLKAGLLLNHDLIKRNTFTFEDVRGDVWYDVPTRGFHSTMCLELNTRYPDPCIDDIVTLIFLNMAPLHKAPYDRLLFSLALYRLMQKPVI